MPWPARDTTPRCSAATAGRFGPRPACDDAGVRAFHCPHCGRMVFFENSVCLNCGTALGFQWPERRIVESEGKPRCANERLAECNWIAPSPGALCACCALTRTRPADHDPEGLEGF